MFFYDGSSAKARPLFSDYATFLEVERADAPKRVEVLPEEGRVEPAAAAPVEPAAAVEPAATAVEPAAAAVEPAAAAVEAAAAAVEAAAAVAAPVKADAIAVSASAALPADPSPRPPPMLAPQRGGDRILGSCCRGV